MSGYLQGNRVLDLSDDRGLFCGRLLADLGADVIAVEPPGGSRARDCGPFHNDKPDRERSLYWFYNCLNKKSITLNLEVDIGRQIFHRLASKADFIIESFEPGYMDSLGLGYADLAKTNQRLIMTSITPFGQTGPYAHYKMTDLCLQAMGGLAYMHGDVDRPPVRIGGGPQAYYLGGLQGAIGSIMAYYDRESSGRGQHVDVSIQEAVELSTILFIVFWDAMKIDETRTGRDRAIHRAGKEALLQRVVYECRDGFYHFFLAGGAQVGRVTASKAMVRLGNEHGMLSELTNYDWSSYNASTISNQEQRAMEDLIENFTRTMNREQLLEEGVSRGVHVGIINTPREFINNPQQQARDFWVNVEHPELGDNLVYPGAPVKLEGWRQEASRRAPLIGEHNEEIYCREMGYTAKELNALKSSGIV